MVLLKELFNEAYTKYGYNSNCKKKSRVMVKSSESGFFNISVVERYDAKKGYVFRYSWVDENNERHRSESIDLYRLRKKVLTNGWDWGIYNIPLAHQLLMRFNVPYNVSCLK